MDLGFPKGLVLLENTFKRITYGHDYFIINDLAKVDIGERFAFYEPGNRIVIPVHFEDFSYNVYGPLDIVNTRLIDAEVFFDEYDKSCWQTENEYKGGHR